MSNKTKRFIVMTAPLWIIFILAIGVLLLLGEYEAAAGITIGTVASIASALLIFGLISFSCDLADKLYGDD